jgi:hypothetical protein
MKIREKKVVESNQGKLKRKSGKNGKRERI